MPLAAAPLLHAWSRRPASLIRATIVILAVSLALAWLLWIVRGRGNVARFSSAEEAVALVRHAPQHLAAEAMWQGPPPDWWSSPSPDEPGTTKELEADERGGDLVLAWVRERVVNRLGERGQEDALGDLLVWYAAGRYGAAASQPSGFRANLEREGEAGRPFAWELAGDLAALSGEAEWANRCYRLELELRASRHAAGWLLRRALRQAEEGDSQALREARKEPSVWNSSDPVLRLKAATELRDWGAMARAALQADFLENRPGRVLLALATAVVWFVIVAQFAGLGRQQWALYGVSILLGALSATATIIVLLIQEDILGVVREGDDLVTGLVHYVAGVGLREETLKLLFFAPLLPWLLRRGRSIDAVVSAGLVGLGFALSENLGYYDRGGEGVAVGRLLTANILHVALTGVIGFAVYRMLWFRGKYWEEALATFLGMVLAHGFYDSFIALPGLATDLDIGSAIVLALVSWRYFELAEAHFRPSGMRVSVLAIFVLGTALVVGVTMNFAVFGHPPFPAAFFFLAGTAQLLPTAFVFIHRFRDR